MINTYENYREMKAREIGYFDYDVSSKDVRNGLKGKEQVK
jgi:hypothetical protein